jgi:hypothetical protein
MSVLTELRNRGVKDVFFVVCDGLKSLPEVVGNVWPLATVQTCIIHLIRNTFRLAARQHWDELKRDIRPIYTAVSAAAARVAFEEMAAKWGSRYAAIVRLWDNLLAIDWAPHPDEGDKMLFIFDGSQLTNKQVTELRFVDGEIASVRFVTAEKLDKVTGG